MSKVKKYSLILIVIALLSMFHLSYFENYELGWVYRNYKGIRAALVVGSLLLSCFAFRSNLLATIMILFTGLYSIVMGLELYIIVLDDFVFNFDNALSFIVFGIIQVIVSILLLSESNMGFKEKENQKEIEAHRVYTDWDV